MQNRLAYPDYHNAPVPSFGGLEAALLIVGLAPGLHGANATGRPFTGDYAGVILYGALQRAGLTEGEYAPEKLGARGDKRGANKILDPRSSTLNPGDGFTLPNVRITNAVRCVPPENKPTPEEIRTCNGFLKNEIAAMPNLKVILSLGQISHNAVVRALGLKASQVKFAHGAEHRVEARGARGETILLNSYHTSRYNMNTRVLTEDMFDKVIARAKAIIQKMVFNPSAE